MGKESPPPYDRAGTNAVAAGPENFVGHRMRACTAVVRVFQVKSKRKREKACAVEDLAEAKAGVGVHQIRDLPHTLGHFQTVYINLPQLVGGSKLPPLLTIMVASFWVSLLTLHALRHLRPCANAGFIPIPQHQPSNYYCSSRSTAQPSPNPHSSTSFFARLPKAEGGLVSKQVFTTALLVVDSAVVLHVDYTLSRATVMLRAPVRVYPTVSMNIATNTQFKQRLLHRSARSARSRRVAVGGRPGPAPLLYN